MNKLKVFLYIDALNYDLITPKIMPFLHDFSQKYFSKKLKNVPGYSFAIQACLLSGKYPDETNLWMPYYYDPEKSPFLFKVLKKIGGYLPLCRVPFLNYLILYATRKVFLRNGVHVNNIPFRIIDKIAIYPFYYLYEFPFFKAMQMSLMEKYGIKLTYLGPPKIKTRFYYHLIEYLKKSKYDKQLIILYDDALDGLGHKFGPKSEQYLNYVKYLDRVLMVLYKKLKNISRDEFTFTVFSDHGQCEQTNTIDIISKLGKEDLKFYNDYICFVDATIALFWPKNEKIKIKLLNVLREIKMGKVFDKEIKHRYHLRFNDERYGEIFFILNPGITFFPNFFSSFAAFRGLHGYSPETEVQKALLISNKDIGSRISHVKDIRKLLLENEWRG